MLVKVPLPGNASTGATGAVVSMVKVLVALGSEELLAASVAMALTVWVPGSSAGTGVQVQAPPALVTTVHTKVPSTRTARLLLASAVPL